VRLALFTDYAVSGSQLGYFRRVKSLDAFPHIYENSCKCEGLSTTSRGDVEELRTLASAYVLHPCDTCILVFRRTERQSDGSPMKVGVARRQRRQRKQRGVRRKYLN